MLLLKLEVILLVFAVVLLMQFKQEDALIMLSQEVESAPVALVARHARLTKADELVGRNIELKLRNVLL